VPIAMGSLVNFIERAADLLAPIDGLHWKQLLAGLVDGHRRHRPQGARPEAARGAQRLHRALPQPRVRVFQYEPTRPARPSSRSSAVPRHAHRRRRASLQRVYATGACRGRAATRTAAASSATPRRRSPCSRRGRRVHRRDVRRRGEGAQKLGLVGRRLVEPAASFIRPSPTDFERGCGRRADAAAVRAADGRRRLLPAARERALPLHRRPRRPHRQLATEREFQNVAKLRLNMLFAGSTEGAHRACVLLGIVATCRAVGVPVQAYLDLGLRAPRHPPRRLRPAARGDMTPAAFK
jgi:hypothetical protein